MSNSDTVRDIYASFGAGDLPAVLSRLADDVAWDHLGDHPAQAAGIPYLQARSGRDEVVGFFESMRAFDLHAFEPFAILEGGRRVAAVIRIDLTIRATGRRVRDEEVHLWTFDEEGRVVAFRHVLDTAKHIAAFATADGGA